MAQMLGFNRRNIDCFYDDLEKKSWKRDSFTADRIRNVDETGVCTVQKTVKQIFQKGERQVGAVTSQEPGDLVTVCNSINAIGNHMPPFLVFPRVNDSAVGIKIDSKPVLKVVSKSARFAETGLKIPGNLPQDPQGQYSITENDIESLYTVFYAQVNYLQGEYSNLVVRSTFDDETSRLFRSFENNTQAFSERSLTNVRLAAELSALSTRSSSRPSSSRNNYRGRGQSFNPSNFRRSHINSSIVEALKLSHLTTPRPRE
ncbi:transposase [Elysia marginata]|uniref:Transposase n=1 Tax=Elysia marginata TaxID=1093978 RepID=A0AAV4JAD1_9GAST|nr:transposase [Elysia marginata]